MPTTYNIRVTPNARINKVEKANDILKIHVTAPAVEGKANKAAIDLLADYFRIKRSAIRILRGEKSRNKLIEIG